MTASYGGKCFPCWLSGCNKKVCNCKCHILRPPFESYSPQDKMLVSSRIPHPISCEMAERMSWYYLRSSLDESNIIDRGRRIKRHPTMDEQEQSKVRFTNPRHKNNGERKPLK